MNLLLVVSGPDRVGKTTLISKLANCGVMGGKAFVKHHGPPPQDYPNVYCYHMDSAHQWKKSGCSFALFDRSWPCTYILERIRCGNSGHFDSLIEFEIKLSQMDFNVVHIGVFKPWYWSAEKHIEEIKIQNPELSLSRIRDEYCKRMKEHKVYYGELRDFYENITMFPSLIIHELDPDPVAILREVMGFHDS